MKQGICSVVSVCVFPGKTVGSLSMLVMAFCLALLPTGARTHVLLFIIFGVISGCATVRSFVFCGFFHCINVNLFMAILYMLTITRNYCVNSTK